MRSVEIEEAQDLELVLAEPACSAGVSSAEFAASSNSCYLPSLFEPRSRSVRLAKVPVIDGTKTMGIVLLPEAMTGMILVGGEDLHAVRLQMVVASMLMAAALVSRPAACAAFAPHAERAGCPSAPRPPVSLIRRSVLLWLDLPPRAGNLLDHQRKPPRKVGDRVVVVEEVRRAPHVLVVVDHDHTVHAVFAVALLDRPIGVDDPVVITPAAVVKRSAAEQQEDAGLGLRVVVAADRVCQPGRRSHTAR